jgi:hypothetical protein
MVGKRFFTKLFEVRMRFRAKVRSCPMHCMLTLTHKAVYFLIKFQTTCRLHMAKKLIRKQAKQKKNDKHVPGAVQHCRLHCLVTTQSAAVLSEG